MKKAILLTLRLLLFSGYALSQATGTIKGTITDSKTKEGIPFVNIVLFQNGVQGAATTSDFEGSYKISELTPGIYDVKFQYVGYQSREIKSVQILAGVTQRLNVSLSSNTTEIQSVDVVVHERPLVSQDQTMSGQTLTSKEIMAMPTRSISGAPRKKGGHSRTNIQGSRANNTVIYINGIKTVGNPGQQENIPENNSISNFNTESYAPLSENHFKFALDEPFSTFSIDVDNASYTNVRRMIQSGNQPPKDAVRIEEFINYFDYSYKQPTDTHPFAIHTEIGACSWNPDAKLLKIGLQGEEIKFKDSKPLNLVFLIDVSGSMQSYNKLDWVKKSLKKLVEKLREKDHVSMVVYAGATGVVLNPTSGKEKDKVIKAINSLQSGGSTAGGAGLKLAYKLADKNFDPESVNRIILATDGDFNIGVSSDSEMKEIVEQNRDKGISITVLGYGMGNYKDSKMEIIANHGNGNYFYIDKLSEAERVLSDKITSTLYTIAKDVKIQLEFNPSNVESYRLVGYSNRKLNKEDFNNDRIDAGDLGPGHSVTALYEVVLRNKSVEAPKTIDDMRYQKKLEIKDEMSDELLLVKLRYKKPLGKVSTYLDHIVNVEDLKQPTSSDFLFCSAITEFGLYLRKSPYGNGVHAKDILRFKEQLGKLDRKQDEFFDLVKKSKKFRDLAIK